MKARHRFAETGADHEQPGEREARPTGPEKARMRATMIAGRDGSMPETMPPRTSPSLSFSQDRIRPTSSLNQPWTWVCWACWPSRWAWLLQREAPEPAFAPASADPRRSGPGRWCRRPRTYSARPLACIASERLAGTLPARPVAPRPRWRKPAAAWLGEGLRNDPAALWHGCRPRRRRRTRSAVRRHPRPRGAVRIGQLPGGVDDAVGGVGDRADDLVTAGAQAVRRRSGRPDRRNGPDQRSRCRADGPARRGRC